MLRSDGAVIGFGGIGNFIQSGGTLTVQQAMSIGFNPGSVGLYSLSGGTAVIANDALVGSSGYGILHQTGGMLAVQRILVLGFGAGGSGSYDLIGGQLRAFSISAGGGAAAFDFDGGALVATNNTALLFSNFSPTINAGGATFDTQGFDVTITSPLNHKPALGATLDGGLTKLGSGTLTLAGANTYTGPTIVKSGVLNVSNAARPQILAGPGGADVTWGGAIVFDYSGGGASPADAVRQALQSGFASKWLAGQLRSTDATAQIGLGYADDGIAKVLVRPAYYGDTDLNGSVNIDDFGQLAAHFNGSAAWSDGDFNFDGLANIDDFGQLAANFNLSLASQARNGSPMPDPATGLALGTMLLVRRRRADGRKTQPEP